MKFAAVDGPDDNLRVIKVFDFDQPFFLTSHDPAVQRKLLKRLGLARHPKMWVDLDERTDVVEGDPFPIGPAREPEPSHDHNP